MNDSIKLVVCLSNCSIDTAWSDEFSLLICSYSYSYSSSSPYSCSWTNKNEMALFECQKFSTTVFPLDQSSTSGSIFLAYGNGWGICQGLTSVWKCSAAQQSGAAAVLPSDFKLDSIPAGVGNRLGRPVDPLWVSDHDLWWRACKIGSIWTRCRVHGPHLGRDAASETDKSTSRHRWLLCKVVCSVCTQAGWTMQLWLQQTKNDKAH